jgi:predicted AlkP superfamily pyrophosphatase or phosphodiesterase
VSAVPVAAEPDVTTVIVVSVDALNPAAIRQLGTERAPTLNRLIDEGAATLNARTEHEQTNTLPNHTGMVTSRRINATYGGHGVVWNDDRLRPPTVQAAAGHPVSSVFSVLHSAGDKTAVFASKTKFSLFERSWPDGVDKYVERDDNGVLVRKLRKDISGHTRAFRFVHLSAPDVAGHAYGFMGPEYLDAVAATDKRLGRVVDTIQADPDLADHTVLVVTADHGGNGVNHRDEKKLANYRIPFIVWGAGVAPGTDLYDLNPEYADPGKARTTYADPEQPVRNGDVANLVTDLLGRSQVKGSELDAEQHLDVS